ncbi:hypothetical protein ND861_00710 [Leptospira sp. 2 VSF19]|uniref:Uncharacterized protein n=1 Tax=Leptospira soteropolitanensis TaxID=2950025 RepID=A0AAW5VA99_9LEPT|nr:hypothetical protein [Leptospira soteropolitanensis]MCW7491163.1 hypothetical protein [Leptospira soteropolitanensis]MCW7498747.1 hypothetical protein [Leptospira soteropolitanensis]MCW7521660.1 hypothetical protein [Leptospira soteropolitanensis]MCW7524851.1 hypothetical protein [Leptospira soteropolitanensis]MCW7528718.1 hypothetical protein [Leptospira soteropolitanensis]
MKISNCISLKILSTKYSLLAIVIWILNDAIFKSQFHNFVTGKISDIIGLFFTPLMLTALALYFCNFKKYNVSESKILFVSMFFVALMFILLNLNQKTNDLLTNKLWFFIPSKGTADQTDMYCLIVYIPLLLLFYKFKKRQSGKSIYILKYLTPILVSFALINTSAVGNLETDFSRIAFFLLLGDMNDQIISITPKDGDSFHKSEMIDFQWTYKNYFGVTEPSVYDNEIDCGITQDLSELRRYVTGKFQNYVVQIANNELFSPIESEFHSNGNEKKVKSAINNSGTYFYRVALMYKNKEDCAEEKFLIFLPQQVKKIFLLE